MISRFPVERDASGRELPLLLAAFDGRYLLRELFPRALAGARAVGGDSAAKQLSEGGASKDRENLRLNAVHLYTREEVYREVNRLLRLPSGANEPTAPLWPYVAILQAAFNRTLRKF
jgi:hypothetical protein